LDITNTSDQMVVDVVGNFASKSYTAVGSGQTIGKTFAGQDAAFNVCSSYKSSAGTQISWTSDAASHVRCAVAVNKY
jgi:hypothetical protein